MRKLLLTHCAIDYLQNRKLGVEANTTSKLIEGELKIAHPQQLVKKQR